MNTIIPINQQTQTEIENSTTHAPSSDDVQIEDDGLTEKERRFADFYAGDARFNGTEAASLAGYTGDRNTLHVTGSRLLRKPTVIAYMRTRAQQVMSTTEVMEQLAEMIRRDEMEYAQTYKNKHGATVAVRLDLNSKVKAIELMMKAHGLLIEKQEITNTGTPQVTQVAVYLNPAGIPHDQTIDSTATETHTNTHNE